MEKYRNIATRTLKIMEIKFKGDESLDKLIQRIRYGLLLPASSTEVEIKKLSMLIATKIEEQAELEEIDDLIEKLDFEVSYLLWD
jgi:hypothetical protein